MNPTSTFENFNTQMGQFRQFWARREPRAIVTRGREGENYPICTDGKLVFMLPMNAFENLVFQRESSFLYQNFTNF